MNHLAHDKKLQQRNPGPVPIRTRRAKSFPIVLMIVCSVAHGEALSGRITQIVDGDTLILADATHTPHRVRLRGVDAPALAQAFGQNAKTLLAARALNQTATGNCRPLDRTGYRPCLIRINGVDLGLEQIRIGAAWYRQTPDELPDEATRTDYAQAEFQAKIHRDGLWNSRNPTPPWSWRP